LQNALAASGGVPLHAAGDAAVIAASKGMKALTEERRRTRRIARWRRRGRRRRRRRRKRKGEEEEALRNSVSGSEMGFPGGVLAGLRLKKHQHRFSGGLLLAGRPFSMLSESSRNPTRNPDSRHGCGIV
jgi:hypothetical protein